MNRRTLFSSSCHSQLYSADIVWPERSQRMRCRPHCVIPDTPGWPAPGQGRSRVWERSSDGTQRLRVVAIVDSTAKVGGLCTQISRRPLVPPPSLAAGTVWLGDAREAVVGDAVGVVRGDSSARRCGFVARLGQSLATDCQGERFTRSARVTAQSAQILPPSSGSVGVGTARAHTTGPQPCTRPVHRRLFLCATGQARGYGRLARFPSRTVRNGALRQRAARSWRQRHRSLPDAQQNQPALLCRVAPVTDSLHASPICVSRPWTQPCAGIPRGRLCRVCRVGPITALRHSWLSSSLEHSLKHSHMLVILMRSPRQMRRGQQTWWRAEGREFKGQIARPEACLKQTTACRPRRIAAHPRQACRESRDSVGMVDDSR